MGKIFGALALSLVSLLAVAAPSQDDSKRIVHGPFENKIYPNSEIYFSESNDDSRPVHLIVSRMDSKGQQYEQFVDGYELAGGAPHIESLFFHEVNGKTNAIVIMTWDIHHRAEGVMGNIYQVHAYHDEDGELVPNDVFTNSGAMSGYEGIENGQEITYPLKTSSDVRRYIDEYLNPLHNN